MGSISYRYNDNINMYNSLEAAWAASAIDMVIIILIKKLIRQELRGCMGIISYRYDDTNNNYIYMS